jgi:hypothetical protein
MRTASLIGWGLLAGVAVFTLVAIKTGSSVSLGCGLACLLGLSPVLAYVRAHSPQMTRRLNRD